MPRNFEELGRGQGGLGAGGASSTVAAVKRQLSDLSKRVLGRWGTLPFKALQVPLGVKINFEREDAELLGECTVEALGASAVVVDPATEARWRCGFAYFAAATEIGLAMWEQKLTEKRAALEEKK